MKDVRTLLKIACEKTASDLHLQVGKPPCLRIHGELYFLSEEEDLTQEEVENMIFSLIAPEQKEVLFVNKELDFSFELKDYARFRVNVFFQRGKLGASFRLIPLKIATIEDLGLPGICHKFAQLKQGFVLITGPTGHGKSTTLAAIVDEIVKTRACHVVTIEDPIEFIFEGGKALVSQRELGSDTYSWTAALKAVFREDPNVILIGEMRDYETISTALTLAETGHLVFSTLHTNSASQTISRIIDSFPEEAKNQISIQLSGCLEAVFSQRLVPTLDGKRTVAYEVLIASSAVRTAIRENNIHLIDNIINTSAEEGMVPLENTLARLVEEGKISLETAQAFALRPKDVIQMLRRR